MWSLTLYWVFFGVNTPLPSPCFWQGDVVMMFSFPWLLAVTLCYIIPFNPADGCFLAHHPSSLLPFSSFFLDNIIMDSPVSHFCVLFLRIWPSIRSSFTHLPSLPFLLFECQFHTPDVHYICHCLFSLDWKSTCTAKPTWGEKTKAKGAVSSFISTYANILFASLSDGELYAGTSADFMGRDFAIFRTLGTHHPIRTEQHDSRWLNGKVGRTYSVTWEQSLSLIRFW